MERKASILIALFAAIMLLAGYSTAIAGHTGGNVDLYQANGTAVTGTTPYSPHMSCSAATSTCHPSAGSVGVNYYFNDSGQTVDATHKLVSSVVTTSAAVEVGGGGSHDYGSGTSMSTHVQGVLGSATATDTTVYWQAYQNKSFAHGVSVARHMNQGRNETYTNTARAQYGDLFFTSSPGMYGKY